MQGRLTVARAGERLAALERKVAELESEYAAFGLYGQVYERARRGELPPEQYPFYDDLRAANEEFEVLKGFSYDAQRRSVEHAQDLMDLKSLEGVERTYDIRKRLAFKRHGLKDRDIDVGTGLPKRWPNGFEMPDWDWIFRGKYGAEFDSLREKVRREDAVHEDRLDYAHRIIELGNGSPLLWFSLDGYG
ncbi:hypothetical protein KY327_01975 [Candidatus Woesearchaeota archaeon]|nr:hypothetical protein [Candidatus Woesearchaeota archaeon]